MLLFNYARYLQLSVEKHCIYKQYSIYIYITLYQAWVRSVEYYCECIQSCVPILARRAVTMSQPNGEKAFVSFVRRHIERHGPLDLVAVYGGLADCGASRHVQICVYVYSHP